VVVARHQGTQVRQGADVGADLLHLIVGHVQADEVREAADLGREGSHEIVIEVKGEDLGGAFDEELWEDVKLGVGEVFRVAVAEERVHLRHLLCVLGLRCKRCRRLPRGRSRRRSTLRSITTTSTTLTTTGHLSDESAIKGSADDEQMLLGPSLRCDYMNCSEAISYY